jgi:pimeloyl-ACP methyl ester carboxylesterase
VLVHTIKWIGARRGCSHPTNRTFGNLAFLQYEHRKRRLAQRTKQRRRLCRLKHIVEETGEQQVLYVGHSQGTAVALAALSQSGYVSNHVRAAALLAPTVFMHNTQSSILRALAALHTELCAPLMPSLLMCASSSWLLVRLQMPAHHQGVCLF